jgi:hypothetical protein
LGGTARQVRPAAPAGNLARRRPPRKPGSPANRRQPSGAGAWALLLAGFRASGNARRARDDSGWACALGNLNDRRRVKSGLPSRAFGAAGLCGAPEHPSRSRARRRVASQRRGAPRVRCAPRRGTAAAVTLPSLTAAAAAAAQRGPLPGQHAVESSSLVPRPPDPGPQVPGISLPGRTSRCPGPSCSLAA